MILTLPLGVYVEAISVAELEYLLSRLSVRNTDGVVLVREENVDGELALVRVQNEELNVTGDWRGGWVLGHHQEIWREMQRGATPVQDEEVVCVSVDVDVSRGKDGERLLEAAHFLDRIVEHNLKRKR